MIKTTKPNIKSLSAGDKSVRSVMFGVALTLSSVGASGQIYDQQQFDGGKPFFLLPVIKAAFSSALSGAASTLFGNIFNKIFNPVTCWSQAVGSNQPGSNCATGPDNTGGSSNGTNIAPAFNAPGTSPGFQMTPDQAREQLAQAPAFTLKIDKLSSDQAGAAVENSIEFRREPDSNDLSYMISTGEFFAMRFQTTVPGRVRIMNEAAGQTAQIGYYEVIPDSDNRMPRSRGMRVDPPAGIEYLHIEFTPCVSNSMQSDPRVASFSPYLAPCTNESATKQFTGGKYFPPAGSKVIVNLDSPDPTQPVAARELNKGETMTMRIVVNHVEPATGLPLLQ